MIFGSLFSGGGGGDYGFIRAGLSPAFGCEIDAKARAVLRRNHPGIPIYHDVREVTRARLIADGIPLPRLIFGGSPCQDLSVAGKRAGLGGARSGLFYEQCRIADECDADWVVWENVVGALSSNKGADFGEVLGGLTGNTPAVPDKGWRSAGVCVGPKRVAVWRVLDSQAFGVPQRRRRVFVVAGPRAVARRLVELLFESESSGGDPAPSGTPRPIATGAAQWRAATSSTGTPTDIVQCLTTKDRQDPFVESFILESGMTGTNLPVAEVVGTLAPGAHGSGPRAVNGQDAYSGQLIPVHLYSGAGSEVPANNIAFDVAENQRAEIRLSTVASTVSRGGGKPGQGNNVVMYGEPADEAAPLGSFTSDGSNIVVRRLTPLECERLMGWPDLWTAEGIDDDGKAISIPPTHRYRICGNGIVATVTEWIGERLIKANQPATHHGSPSSTKGQ